MNSTDTLLLKFFLAAIVMLPILMLFFRAARRHGTVEAWTGCIATLVFVAALAALLTMIWRTI